MILSFDAPLSAYAVQADASLEKYRQGCASTPILFTPVPRESAHSTRPCTALVERSARPDIKDTLWHATLPGWADYNNQQEVTMFLRLAASN
jgi:hypothetical protein